MRTKTHKNDKKTLSKKAQVRAGLLFKDSPASSHPGSRRSSRPVSRYASEDEFESVHGDGDELASSVTISTASDVEEEEDDEEGSSFVWEEDWPEQLSSCVTDFTEGKRGHHLVREENLKKYLQLVRSHVAYDEIRTAAPAIVQALLKSIKSSDSVQERVLALDSLSVTILTYNSESFSDAASIWTLVRSPLQTVCETAGDAAVKVHAIRALATAFVSDCRSRESAEKLLEFLVEIVESDGRAIEAEDSGPVVVAAMQAWSFVADVHSGRAGDAGRAMEAFVDQLESNDVDVKLAAATQLAFLFEAARESPDGANDDEDSESDEEDKNEKLYLPYQPGRVVQRLVTVARGSRTSSKRRRHKSGNWFRRLIGSIDKGLPLCHQTVWRRHLRSSGTNVWTILRVDTMSALVGMEHLKGTLGKGLKEHVMDNAMVMEILGGARVKELDQPERPTSPKWGGGMDANAKARIEEMGLMGEVDTDIELSGRESD